MVQDVVDEKELAHANEFIQNGHPKPSGGVAHDDDEETNENIFLFIPNLIGEYTSFRQHQSSVLIVNPLRLLENRLGHCVALLYALASAPLQLPLLHLLSAGCCRWYRSAKV